MYEDIHKGVAIAFGYSYFNSTNVNDSPFFARITVRFSGFPHPEASLKGQQEARIWDLWDLLPITQQAMASDNSVG